MAVVREWFDRLIVLSLCAMIFTLPFSKSAVEVCFVIALVLWALRKALFREPHISAVRLFKWIFTGLNPFICLFILANLISAYYSVSIVLSLEGLFFKLLEGILLFFIIADTINNRKRLKAILVSMFLSMLLIGADGIFQALTGRDFLRHYNEIGGIQASFVNRNGFGAWLVVMISIVLGVIAMDKKQMPERIAKNIMWAMAGVLTLCLALTLSRGALVGFAFAMMFFLGIKNSKVFLVAVAFILAVSLLGIVYFINVNPDVNKFFTEFTRIRSWDNALSFTKDFIIYIKWQLIPEQLAPVMNEQGDAARVELWWESLLIIKNFPVFGCGLNTYSAIALRYPGVMIGTYPHNSYLQMAAETGIVGLASFVLLIAALFRTSLANIRKIKDGFYGGILAALLAGLFGFLVHSFFDVHFYSLQLVNLMWFIMGLIIAVGRIALKEESAPGESNAQK